MISEAKWNELFGESDDKEDFVGFDAESGEGCESGAESEAVGEGDESESEVDSEVAEGGGGEKEDLMFEGVERGVKVVVEKLDCLVLRVRRGLEDKVVRGRWVPSMARSGWLWKSWLLFSMMMVFEW